MNAGLRALIFDVDGTLADTEEFHRRAFNATFAAAGLGWWWNRETYRQLLRVAGGRQRMRAYAEREDADMAQHEDLDELLAELHVRKTIRYDASLREQPLPLRPGIARLFAEADAAGILLTIATTTTAANVDALLYPAFGRFWRDRFAAVVSGTEITRLKPAPDVYLEALRQLRLDADACLAFEDSANGIRSAQAAGLAVIVTPTWYSLAESLPPALVSLPHLGDPGNPLPSDAPGAPIVDLARLREWHAHAVATEPLGRALACC
jgi:HAD superfamily hydrolase (TIGR01509 family)